MRRGADFATTIRRGRRAAAPTVVVHAMASSSLADPRVGFVVGRVVGPAVTRNQVRRRLRHLLRDRLDGLAPGTFLVVRAQPAAAAATSAALAHDLDAALERVVAGRGSGR